MIEGNPSLTVDEAWRSGWLGGEVNGVSIDSIQASSGGGDVIIVRSESFTVDDYEFRVFVESLFTDPTSLGRATIWQGTNFYSSGVQSLVSEDHHATIIPIGANDFDR